MDIDQFIERPPWIGGDLQTLRDTLRPEKLPPDKGQELKIEVPGYGINKKANGKLLAFLDLPEKAKNPLGLIVILHGLGGSSKRVGLRRMALSFQAAGYAVLRLNLRGADPGRHLAPGTYAAKCNSDLIPVLVKAREVCKRLSQSSNDSSQCSIPLLGAGISLGGTILLNACLGINKIHESNKPLLDGLVCTSSPLDLAVCSDKIEQPRNKFYQQWILQRLIRQTLEDPFKVSQEELKALSNKLKAKSTQLTIRSFDSLITAPRWGYLDVEDYYLNASPLPKLLNSQYRKLLPPTLFLQSLDDPWVPAISAQKLGELLDSTSESHLKVVITKKGGHNGFHGRDGCWGDKLVNKWFAYLTG